MISDHGLHPFGSGPVATVYSGLCAGVPVAFKVFPRAFDRQTMAAFERERAALRRVPSVLPVDAVDRLPDGRQALRMGLCAESLAAVVARTGPLPHAEAAALGHAVARALAAAHAAGVVHGGLHPRNVLFLPKGDPVLADFGLPLRHAFPRDPLHAVEYQPPETLRTGDPDEHTDIYALGAVLHLALTGASPHPGRLGEQPGERVLRVLKEPVPAINRPDVPLPLATLVARLLAADPARRPPTAAAVATQLATMRAPATPPPAPRRAVRSSSAERVAVVRPPAPRQPTSPPPATPPAGQARADLPGAAPAPADRSGADEAGTRLPAAPASQASADQSQAPSATDPSPIGQAAAGPAPADQAGTPSPTPEPAKDTLAGPTPTASSSTTAERAQVTPDQAEIPSPTTEPRTAEDAPAGPTPAHTPDTSHQADTSSPATEPAENAPAGPTPTGSSPATAERAQADPDQVKTPSPATEPPAATEARADVEPDSRAPEPPTHRLGAHLPAAGSSPAARADQAPTESPLLDQAGGPHPTGPPGADPTDPTDAAGTESPTDTSPPAHSAPAQQPEDALPDWSYSPDFGPRGDLDLDGDFGPRSDLDGHGLDPDVDEHWPPQAGPVPDALPLFTEVTGSFAPPGRAGRSRRVPVAVAGGVLVVAATALVLVLRDEPDVVGAASRVPVTSWSTSTTATPVQVELAEPKDLGDHVELSWRSEGTLDFGVVVAAEGSPARVELVDRTTQARIPIDPVRGYCFLVQATDGTQVYESQAKSIRGAKCRK